MHTLIVRTVRFRDANAERRASLLSAEHQYRQEHELSRRLPGPEYPGTSVSAWNLLTSLLDLREWEAASALFVSDLLWLLDCDPATLRADQRQIRGYLTAMLIGEVGERGECAEAAARAAEVSAVLAMTRRSVECAQSYQMMCTVRWALNRSSGARSTPYLTAQAE